MWFLYLLCIIIALIIDYVIAKKFADIAEMKGHDSGTYFWFTFLFGIIGMLMVIALPNTKETTAKDLPVEPSVKIGKQNTTAIPMAATIQDGKKVCPKCGIIQKMEKTECWNCGQPFSN